MLACCLATTRGIACTVSKRTVALQGLPVVRAAPGAPTFTLLARTADEYVHRRETTQHVCRHKAPYA